MRAWGGVRGFVARCPGCEPGRAGPGRGCVSRADPHRAVPGAREWPEGGGRSGVRVCAVVSGPCPRRRVKSQGWWPHWWVTVGGAENFRASDPAENRFFN